MACLTLQPLSEGAVLGDNTFSGNMFGSYVTRLISLGILAGGTWLFSRFFRALFSLIYLVTPAGSITAIIHIVKLKRSNMLASYR